jgi:hypothetical protein
MRAVGVVFWAMLLAFVGAIGVDAKEYSFQAGSWPGTIVYDDKSSSFQDCYITSDYKSGITLYFQIDYDQTFHIAFTHPDWRLTVGDEFSVGLAVDRLWSGTYRAYAYDTNAVDIKFEAPGDLLDALRYGSVMRVKAQSDSFSFQLEGTNVALQRLHQCFVENARAGGSNTNPFGSGSSSGTTSSNPFGGSGGNPFKSNQGGGSQTASTTDAGKARSDAVDLFQSLLQDSRLAHFQVLRGNAIPKALGDRDLVWGQGSTYGGLSVVVGDISPEDETARLASEDGKSCKGEIASAAVNSALSNGDIVRRLAVSCHEGQSSWYTYYSIYKTYSPAGAFMVSHVSVDDQNAAKSADQAFFDIISSAMSTPTTSQ